MTGLKLWLKNKYANIEIDEYVVISNHCHGGYAGQLVEGQKDWVDGLCR